MISVKIAIRMRNGSKGLFLSEYGFTYDEYLAEIKDLFPEVKVMLVEVPRILEDQVA